MKLMPITILASTLMLGVAACSNDSPTNLPPGHYESSKSSTDAAGTSRTTDTSTDVKLDANGKKTAVVKKKKTTDPKGLFNKSSSESTESYSDR